jgi:hypothetical protein
MDFESGMMPGMPTGDKPFGNSRSLVPEISGRGVMGKSVKPCDHGKMVQPKMVTNLRNHGTTDLKGTGKS